MLTRGKGPRLLQSGLVSARVGEGLVDHLEELAAVEDLNERRTLAVGSDHPNGGCVLDANALANGQPALITKLATSGPMQQVAVSPISTFGPVQAGPSRQRSGERPSPAHSRPTRPSMVD